MPTALVVTAIKHEFQAVVDHLMSPSRQNDDKGTVYQVGSFRNWRVVVVQTGAGNATAGTVTAAGIEAYQPDVVLFVGVAGRVKDVAIGDVVAASRVRGYEAGKETAEGFLPREIGGPVDYALEQIARSIAAESRWSLARDGSRRGPVAWVAPIAAGDKVVATAEGSIAALLAKHFSDVLAIEMEGVGFLEAVRVAGKRGLIIRGISDLLTGKSESDAAGSQQFASANAAAFAFEVLEWCELPSQKADSATEQSEQVLPPPCWAAMAQLRNQNVEVASRLGNYLQTDRQPRSLVVEVVGAPPSWLSLEDGLAWVVIGHFAAAHGLAEFSSIAYERAALAGLALRSHWLVFAANGAVLSGDIARANALLGAARELAPDDVLVKRTEAAIHSDLAALQAPLPAGADVTREERLMIDSWRGRVLHVQGDDVAALQVFRDLQVDFPERAAPLLQQAEIFVRRAARNQSADRIADLASAVELGLKARATIRQWHGVSEQASLLVAQAYIESADAPAALAICLEPPDGSANSREAFALAELAGTAALISGRMDLLPQIIERIPAGFKRSIYEAMLAKRRGADEQSVEALIRSALAVAQNDGDRFAALYQLAIMPAGDLEKDLAELRNRDTVLGDIAIAAWDSASGRYEAAKERLRAHVDKSIEAVEELGNVYRSQGDARGAADVYRIGSSRLGAPHLLVEGIDVASNLGDHSLAKELANEAISRLPEGSSARLHALRRLLEEAGREANWKQVEEVGAQLQREDAGDVLATWAVIIGLTNQIRLREAWDVWRGSPGLEPSDEYQARALVALIGEFDRTTSGVARIVDLHDRFSSEDFRSTCLITLLTLTPAPEIPPALLTRIRQAVERYVAEFPDSRYLRRIEFVDSETFLRDIASVLRPGHEQRQALGERVAQGQLPYGLLAAALSEPYAAALLERAAGHLVAHDYNPVELAEDIRLASRSFGGAVVVDTSALATLAGVPQLWDRITSTFHRVVTADIAWADAMAAARRYATASDLSIALDSRGSEALVRVQPADVRARLRREADWLNKAIQATEQRSVRTLDVLPAADVNPHGNWLGPVQIARDSEFALWSDDQAVRRLARDLNIPAFPTIALLHVLLRRQRVSQLDIEAYVSACVATAVVDMEISIANLLSMLRSAGWPLGPLAAPFQRPAFWVNAATALDVTRLVLRSVVADSRDLFSGWLVLFMSESARYLSVSGDRAVGLVLAAGLEEAGLPPVELPDLVVAARELATQRQSPGDPLVVAARVLLETWEVRMAPADAAAAVTATFAALADVDRRLVTQMIADPDRRSGRRG